MATLKDRLNTYRANGTLADTSDEELQNLTKSAGLQAAPITPLGATMIGANPQVAKMAGTPQQKDASLAQSAMPNPQNNLSDVLRRQQARNQATGQEQQSIQKSDEMRNLGQLGDRVSQFIDAQRQKLTDQAGQVKERQVADTLQAASGQDLGQLKEDLKAFQANPNDMNTLLRINTALGRNTNSVLDPKEVDSLYKSTVDTIASQGAANIDDSLQVEDLIGLSTFGYDLPTLSGLLNVDQNQLSKMTVGQLRNEINRVGTEEFNKTNQLEQQATSNQLGQAERGLARQSTREASATGTRASEADYTNLEHSIANADQVQFGGQSYKVDDLLKDDTISGIINDYLNSGEGSEARNRIDKTEPGLSSFINKNQAVLQDAATKMQAGAQSFKDIQEYNRNLSQNLFGGRKLDDRIMSQIAPNSNQLQAGKTDINAVQGRGLLQYVSQLPPDQAAQIADQLNTAIQDNPKLAEQLPGMSPQQWAELGIGQPNSKWSQYVNKVKEAIDIRNMDLSTPEKAVGQLYSDVSDINEVNKRIQQSRIQKLLGFDSGNVNAVGDTNQDGKIDASDNVGAAIVNSAQMPSLHDLVSYGVLPQGVQKQSLGQPGKMDQGQEQLFNKVAPALEDGSLSDEELEKLYPTLTSPELEKLVDSPVGKDLKGQFLQKRLNDNTVNFLGKATASMPDDSMSSQDKIGRYNYLIDSLNNVSSEKYLNQPELDEYKKTLRYLIENETGKKDQALADRLKEQANQISNMVKFGDNKYGGG